MKTRRDVFFCLTFMVAFAVAHVSFGQSVSPRRETQVLDDVMVDGGDVTEFENSDETTTVELDLDDKPTPFVERRTQILQGITLGVGSIRPWEKASFAWHREIDPLHQFGLFVGGGQGKRDGDLEQRTWELNMSVRSFGVFFRRWLENIDGLRFEGNLGYVNWNGKVKPQGQVEDQVPPDDSLSRGFAAQGLMASISVQWVWLFANGLSLDLTILGIQKSFLVKLDVSEDSTFALKAVRLGLTSGELFGFPNLGIGYRF